MSIKNLLSNNTKPDQNLQVESVTASSITYTTLNADTINSNTIINSDILASTTINCDELNCSGTTNLATVLEDISTINTLTVTTQLNLPPTPYTDLSLNFYAEFSDTITWSVNGLSSTPVVNGLHIVRLGTLCVMEIMPFTIIGASVSGPDLRITSNVIIPIEFRPSFMPILLKNTRLTESAVINPVTFRIEGSGDFTVNIQKFFANTYNIGAVSIALPSNNSNTYLTT